MSTSASDRQGRGGRTRGRKRLPKPQLPPELIAMLQPSDDAALIADIERLLTLNAKATLAGRGPLACVHDTSDREARALWSRIYHIQACTEEGVRAKLQLAISEREDDRAVLVASAIPISACVDALRFLNRGSPSLEPKPAA
jgi:hypothetical protein